MSGQTAAWRARYSSRRVGSTCRWKQTRVMVGSFPGGGVVPWVPVRAPGPTARRLEVEVGDVVRVEDERVSEENRGVLADRVGAELSGVELVAFSTGDGALDERLRRVSREV